MPTTRSRGRNEPLQRLETPPKRQRKQKPCRPSHSPGYARGLRMRTLPRSPDSREPVDIVTRDASTQTTPPYLDAITQTYPVFILTNPKLADSRDRTATVTSTSTKRSRDDESEEEPSSKRQQFSTPQNNKSNTLWMFGERTNGDHPRTAPSKTLAASSLRRPIRGPLSKRNAFLATPQRRAIPSNSLSRRPAELENIKPIEQDPKYHEDVPVESDTAQQAQPQIEPHAQTVVPQIPRGGLFGSLRGMVHKGWDIAASFSPLTTRTTSLHDGQPSSNIGHVPYPQLQATLEDSDSVPYPSDVSRRETQTPGAANSRQDNLDSRKHPSSEPSKSRSRYDHLHYVPANNDAVNKAMNGQIEPQRAPTPLSPSSRLKAQNPQLSDAAIESILKKRERKAAMDKEQFGPPQSEEEPKVAPLFGPDSHYVRGTVDPRFLPPTPVYGSGKKRRFEAEEDDASRQKTRGFGLDDEDIDGEAETHSRDESSFDDVDNYAASPSKKQRLTDPMPTTPRSALKKPGGMGSIGRKSVTFGGSITRDIRYHYGPAGQYKGSTFADDSPRSDGSPSSIDHRDVISPTTQLNTLVNSGRRLSARENLGANIPHIDFTLRDPNDDTWRPSLVNPRPGTFRVPDVDEEDPDESMSEDPPEQPQTPRMSHAELPAVSDATTTAAGSLGENGTKAGTTDLALDKARLRAEKYKPKSSSRLSEVARARSRSPSPERNGDVHTDDEEETTTTTTSVATPTKLRPLPAATTAPAVRPVGAPPQPFVPAPLDNIEKGADGLTSHEREHQFDDWAADLTWDAPQTYEDAGTGSAFIHNLIRKNWGEEDSGRSETFWAREFDEIDRAMELAKTQGHRLILITGMEDAVGMGMDGVEVA